MCCLIYKFLLILTQKMQISFLKILPENALKFVSKKMRICVKNFAQLQRWQYIHFIKKKIKLRFVEWMEGKQLRHRIIWDWSLDK